MFKTVSVCLIASFMIVSLIELSCAYSTRFDDYSDHPCARDCSLHTKSMLCEYEWTLEVYMTMSSACQDCLSANSSADCLRERCIVGDGVRREIEIVNRQLPGPMIQVCQGDTILVNVNNRLTSNRVTSIHWHGLKQRRTPHMDGASMVTQCPILPGTSFQYKFKAEEAGTYFWHSHSKIQQSNGVFGAFIVRKAKKINNDELYDLDLKEHVILLSDWKRSSISSRMSYHIHANDDLASVDALLINGKGASTDSFANRLALAEFKVNSGNKYRFRLINAGIQYCPMQFSIDAHNLTVISTDGVDVEPIEVESIYLNPGERYDIVVDASVQPDAAKSSYWIKVRGNGPECTHKGLFQRAVLIYGQDETSNLNSLTPLTYDETRRTGLELKSYAERDQANSLVLLDQLRTSRSDVNPKFNLVDHKIFLKFDMSNTELESDVSSMSRINNIAYEMPDSPLLFNMNNRFKPTRLCNSQTRFSLCGDRNSCSCVHMLEFELNKTIEFIMVDETSQSESQPIHIHGHNFQVLGIEQIDTNELKLNDVVEMDKNGTLKRNLNRPLMKDSLVLPSSGYAVIRLITDNPGIWLLRRHQADSETMLLIRVGESIDLPKEPENWPQCGSFTFKQTVRIAGSISVVQATLPASSSLQIEEHSILEVNIEETTRLDHPSTLIARKVVENPYKFPVSYEIDVDIEKIDFERVYAISARVINKEGRILYISDTFTPILDATSETIRTHIDFEVVYISRTSANNGNDETSPSSTNHMRVLTGLIVLQEGIKQEQLNSVDLSNAIVRVTVEDVSLMDVASVVLGEQIIRSPSRFPIAYRIEYDESKIKSYGRYSVNARIETRDNQLLFLNDVFTSLVGDQNHLLDTVNIKVIWVGTSPTTTNNNLRTIRGSVNCRTKKTIEPGSIIKLSITDVSRMDAPSIKIAELELTGIQSLPFAYAIEFDMPKLSSTSNQVTINAAITNNGALKFINDENIYIFDLIDGKLIENIDFNILAIG